MWSIKTTLFILSCFGLISNNQSQGFNKKNVSDNMPNSTEGVTQSKHIGREGVIETTITKTSETNKTQQAVVKPVHEDLPQSEDIVVPPLHDHEKSSVPKKGVTFIESTEIVENRNVTKNHTIPQKPLVTVSDDDHDEGNGKKLNSSTITIEEIDPQLVKDNNNQYYIVPIIGVILSVPLVAIASSYIYKKSTYWWQHRNYKRMDFLIEGMYQN